MHNVLFSRFGILLAVGIATLSFMLFGPTTAQAQPCCYYTVVVDPNVLCPPRIDSLLFNFSGNNYTRVDGTTYPAGTNVQVPYLTVPCPAGWVSVTLTGVSGPVTIMYPGSQTFRVNATGCCVTVTLTRDALGCPVITITQAPPC